MNYLFSPVRIGALELKNRIVVPPMCQYSATDGRAGTWHTIHYGTLALSGAAMVILEATAVEPAGRISPNDLGIWDDSTAKALAELVQNIKKYSDTPLCLQIAHAGRKASTSRPWEGDATLLPENGGWIPFAPSAIPYHDSDSDPEELTAKQIETLIQKFADAAARAAKCGFDAVEIHAAHGYLLHEFLSPLSNRRTDQYGGSFENRTKIVLDVFSAMRKSFPKEKPIGIRISATDWADGGWTPEESAKLSQKLESLGCAYVHASSGGLTNLQKLKVYPGYQVPLARTVKANVSIPVIGVGLITEAEHAESILGAEDADLVAVGRGMLYDPRWAWHAAAKLGVTIKIAEQYIRSAPHALKRCFLSD